MKVLFYNLGYGRGHDGSLVSYTVHAHRFVHHSRRQQRRVLDQVIRLIEIEQPDVFAYAEVSTGSFRNGRFDQHRYLIDQLKKRSVVDAAVSKYGETLLTSLPFHTGNCNGIISFQSADIAEQYLTGSRKKLVFRVDLGTVTLFAVHLPLISADRRQQLVELAALVNATDGDVVVCGDFNIFDGLDELELLTRYTSLTVAGNGALTYPSAAPRLQLDVFLYRLAGANPQPVLRTIPLLASDHLPISLEW